MPTSDTQKNFSLPQKIADFVCRSTLENRGSPAPKVVIEYAPSKTPEPDCNSNTLHTQASIAERAGVIPELRNALLEDQSVAIALNNLIEIVAQSEAETFLANKIIFWKREIELLQCKLVDCHDPADIQLVHEEISAVRDPSPAVIQKARAMIAKWRQPAAAAIAELCNAAQRVIDEHHKAALEAEREFFANHGVEAQVTMVSSRYASASARIAQFRERVNNKPQGLVLSSPKYMAKAVVAWFE